MKPSLLSVAFAAAGVLASAAAHADAAKAQAVMKGSDCMACHAEATKLVGPSYKDVAKKYAGDTKAPAMLVEKIKKGGSGNWGAVPMTPHPNLKDDDLKVVVDWILSLK